MTDSISDAELADLFRETGPRHHQAYIDADGVDPNWPLWYAADLHARVWDRLGRLLTLSEWVHLLVDADLAAKAQGVTDWPPFYASRIRSFAETPEASGVDAFPRPTSVVPSVTADQMAEVDRLMIEVYGIELLQMMEHAGRAVARVARERFFGGDARGQRVVVLAGTGGNGGGGMVAARHLHNAGAEVAVWTSRPADAYDGVPAHQLAILRQMGVSVGTDEPSPEADLVVDALLGYSLDGAPRGAAADLVRWANKQPAPVLSLDLPSGLDATTGEAFDPHVRAAATVTLALPKTGLAAARDAVGNIYLADIGVPPELYARLGLPAEPLFGTGDLLSL